jgi:hypothetical protein
VIEGFEQLEGGSECTVLVKTDVSGFLKQEERNDRSNVRALLRILKRLSEFGVTQMRNTEQFRDEGKFPSGRAGGAEVKVFAVKAHQLRLYGGFVAVGGKTVFLCIEGTRKKRDRADQDQLMRVARALGDYDGRR